MQPFAGPAVFIVNKCFSFKSVTVKSMIMKYQSLKSAVTLSLVSILLLAVNTSYGAGFWAGSEPYMVKNFQMSPGGSLHVETSGGSVRVSGQNSDQAVVEVYVSSGKWSGDKLDRMVKENYSIKITKTGNRMEAIAKRTSRSWSGGNISISFVVKVPVKTECELNTSGGSLKMENISGKFQSLRTSGGSISIKDVHSGVDLMTSGGSIRVENFSGDLEGRTSGGSIKVENAEGRIDMVTSGGSIKLSELNGKVRATTSGGSVFAQLSQLTGGLYLKTSGGNIHAVIPDGLGLDLDLRGSRVETKLVNFTGEAKRDRITGSVNGGGIPVTLSTSGGSVILEYQ